MSAAEIKATAHLRLAHDKTVLAWLREFGYMQNFAGLNQAVNERGRARVARELDVHGKRIAERRCRS